MQGVSKKFLRSNKCSGLRWLALALALAFTGAPLLPQDGNRPSTTRQKVIRAADSFLSFKTEHVERITAGGASVLRLERKSDNKPVSDDLVIDFEHESLFSNPAHQSLILKSNMERETHTGMQGKAAAFSLPEHQLKIRLPAHLHLSGENLTREAGDFSFAAEFEPKTGNGEFLRRENFVNGKQYLFSISIRNGRLQIKFVNLLALTGNVSKMMLESAELKAIDKVKLNQRNLVVLTYQEGEGKITLQLNNREQAVYELRRSAGENYVVTFENLRKAPIALFSPFRGLADNVLFSNRVLSTDDIAHFGKLTPYGDRYNQRRGVAFSEIFDMGFSESAVTGIAADAETPAETHFTLSARCMNRRFSPNLPEHDLRFEKAAGYSERKCRFVQFKSVFTADNAGEKTPLLRSVTLDYRENPPPESPLPPRIKSMKDETVELELIPNTELDVVKGGRYIIYYGDKPHEPQGAIYFRANTASKGEIIAHKLPIRVIINYDTIAANKSWADKHPRFKRRYPVFEQGLGFYFWVTACDNAWGEAQELQDHESPPSPAVFARFE